MARVLECRDLGMDCDFVAKGQDDNEVLRHAAAHAQEAHGLSSIPPELLEKARGAIKAE